MDCRPIDIYNYVVNSGKEASFLYAVMLHKQDYSIAEIPDSVFEYGEAVSMLHSKLYKLDLKIADPDIIAAIRNHTYITGFISRHNDAYQVHFLVHEYHTAVKPKFEDEIAREVIRYMILKTITALRLDTYEKVDAYIDCN